MTDRYIDLTIRIRPLDAAGYYPVEVESDDGTRVEDGQLKLDAARLRAVQNDAAAYGRLLYDSLFTGSIRDAYLEIGKQAASQADGRLRVRLRIDARAAELHALPWERLYHLRRGDLGPLATSTDTPFSRYTSLKTADFKPVSERPLRMLVAVSNPANLAALGLKPVDLEAELETVRLALAGQGQAEQWSVTLLPGKAGLPRELAERLTAAGWMMEGGPTSLEAIKRRLPGQHIFHFIGHGALAREAERGEGTAALYLENDGGQAERVMDSEIVPTLRALGNDLPHLIFLVACESAKRQIETLAAAEHPFIGLGPKLVQAGVPAVVAMQDKMPIDTARDLTQEFYRRLAEHGEVDRAMSQARYVVYRPNRADWAIPVLFSRLTEGMLFEPPAAPPVNVEGDLAGGRTVTTRQTIVSQEAAAGGVNVATGAGDSSLNFNVGGNLNIGGNVAARDVVTTVTGGSGSEPASWVVLEKGLAKARKAVDSLALSDPDDKDILKDLIAKVEESIKDNDLANLERRLGKIGKTSPEALAAVVKAVLSVAAKVPEPVQAVARKFQ
jgi:hypothetical protein